LITPRRSLVSIILRQDVPELSNNIIQKGLAFDRDWSGSVDRSGRPQGAPRSCPAGLVAEVGLRWWRQEAAITEWRISMSKSAKSKSTKKRLGGLSAAAGAAAKPEEATAIDGKGSKGNPGSKQSRVIAMLQSHSGASIAAMMKATGWQQHSVRGFLAGVVRKRLKLKLASKKVDGERVYHITGGGGSGSRQQKRRAS
jgi:hypothetical protein